MIYERQAKRADYVKFSDAGRQTKLKIKEKHEMEMMLPSGENSDLGDIQESSIEQSVSKGL